MTVVVRLLVFVVTLVFFIALAGEVHAQNKQWVSLFDGKTMNGWEKVGHPKECVGSQRWGIIRFRACLNAGLY